MKPIPDNIEAFHGKLGELPGEFDSLELRQSPAATMERLASVETDLGFEIPTGLKELLTKTAALSFNYGWELPEPLVEVAGQIGLGDFIHGGVVIDVDLLTGNLKQCRNFAVSSWLNDDEFRQDQAFWLNTLPFMALRNGDYLGLDLETASVNYLSHDADSFTFNMPLNSFFEAWSQIGYIGPEHWILEPFFDGNRQLAPQPKQLSAVNELFANAG